jgi:hypothetical protein
LAKLAAAFIVRPNSSRLESLKNMLAWLEKHSSAVQALAGILTLLIAIAALVGVKYQIDASYDTQREQSARDVYREFLNVSISNPDFAQPDYCGLSASPKRASYESYVDYLFYAAEQSLEMDPKLRSVFDSHLEPHATYLCSAEGPSDYEGLTKTMLEEFKTANCAGAKAC